MNRGQGDNQWEQRHWKRAEEERKRTVEQGHNRERKSNSRQQYTCYPKRKENQFKTETTVTPSTSSANSSKVVTNMPKN